MSSWARKELIDRASTTFRGRLWVWLFPVWIQPSIRIRDCDLPFANYQQMGMRKSGPRSDIAPFSQMADCCRQNRSVDLNACNKTGNKRQQS